MHLFKKVLLTLAGLAVLLGAIVGLKVLQIADLIGFATAMEEAGMPPTPVATSLANSDEWEESQGYTGSLRAIQGVTLTAEVGGKVVRIPVENGAMVKEGDILIELDTEKEAAELASAQARLRLANINLERSKGLLEKRIVPRSEVDTAEAVYEQAVSEADNLKAAIAKKVIRAPFSGRVGLRLVNLGQTVSPGDELIPLHDSDPIFVEFSVPQNKLGTISEGSRLRVTADGAEKPFAGTVSAFNPMVDEETRTARVQGTLANPGEVLKPGQFVGVEVLSPELKKVVSVPLSAIVSAAYGDSLFIVEEKEGGHRVRQQFVTIGSIRGDFVSILEGVSPGDRVVTAGAFKLSNDAAVTINDEMQPPPSLSPTPENS